MNQISSKIIIQFKAKIVQAVVGSNSKIRSQLFNVKFNQSFEGNSLQSSCLALSGTFDPLTAECALSLQGECPIIDGVQQVVVGITPNMMKICKPLYYNAI